MTDTKKDGAKRPCVYMLRCKDGSLYTGWTNNLEKRLEEHKTEKVRNIREAVCRWNLRIWSICRIRSRRPGGRQRSKS